MSKSFRSHTPKRIVALITGAGELANAPWPYPNRNLVTAKTREFEQQQAAGQWRLYGHWRGIVLNTVPYGKQEQR